MQGSKVSKGARKRGQLSSLLVEAYQNREALEEKIAEGRRNRKEAGNKYGAFRNVKFVVHTVSRSERFLIITASWLCGRPIKFMLLVPTISSIHGICHHGQCFFFVVRGVLLNEAANDWLRLHADGDGCEPVIFCRRSYGCTGRPETRTV